MKTEETLQQSNKVPHPNQQKKMTKEERKERDYWMGHVTRIDAYKMAEALSKEQASQVAMASTLAITVIREILVEKGICTAEEIEAKSKELVQRLANQQAVQQSEEPDTETSEEVTPEEETLTDEVEPN